MPRTGKRIQNEHLVRENRGGNGNIPKMTDNGLISNQSTSTYLFLFKNSNRVWKISDKNRDQPIIYNKVVNSD